jgi:hypothetical protein
MSLLLTVMWVGRVFGAMANGIDGILLGETTMTVQALDLGLIVPVSIVLAAMTWRGHVTSMLVSAWFVEGVAEVVPIAIFALAAAAGAWQSVRIFRSIAPTAARPPIRASSTAPA